MYFENLALEPLALSSLLAMGKHQQFDIQKLPTSVKFAARKVNQQLSGGFENISGT